MPPPLSLYIHLPWCVRKCPYCDFNSHALRDQLPEQAYVDALIRDLELEAERAGRRPIETIFIGGGTPSLFSAAAIDRLLTAVRAALPVRTDAEITLEANPGTVEQERFAGFREAGVNRLSIGIQSFNDDSLRRLGRIHGREEALRAVAVARHAGFENMNLDLMYGLPDQTVGGALADLQQAIDLAPNHISHYQLTLEPNTLFHARPPELPADDDIYAMQQESQALLAESGFRQYEVSAYAQPDSEARHNLNYWLFGDYLAIGAGAHGKLTDCDSREVRRYAKPRHPRDYQLHAGTPRSFCDERILDRGDRILEFAMNALRLIDGFDIAMCEDRTALDWTAFEPMARKAAEQGWLKIADNRARPTETGLLYLNELLQLFMPEPTRAG